MTDFSKLKEGDKVWSILRGWGAVSSTPQHGNYPIDVDYSDYILAYTIDGKYLTEHLFPELYLTEQVVSDHPREINWTKIPVDTKVTVSDGGQEYTRYFALYTPCAGIKFRAFLYGAKRDAALGTSEWANCRLHPDVEILKEWIKTTGRGL